MNAVAHIAAPRVNLDRAAGFLPTDVTAIGLLIERLEALQRGSELDADILQAMGWHVSPPTRQRACWRVRSPFSSLWQPMPAISTTTDGAAFLSLPGWDYSAGRRGAHGCAWVRDTAVPHGRYFEATMGEPAQCLARCWLHAWRLILLEKSP